MSAFALSPGVLLGNTSGKTVPDLVGPGLTAWTAAKHIATSVFPTGLVVGSANLDEAVIYTVSRAILVTKTEDSDDGTYDADCSLREAIAAAATGDRILIPAGTYTLTVGSEFGLGTELTVDRTLTLIGAGSGDTIIHASTEPLHHRVYAFSLLRL